MTAAQRYLARVLPGADVRQMVRQYLVKVDQRLMVVHAIDQTEAMKQALQQQEGEVVYVGDVSGRTK